MKSNIDELVFPIAAIVIFMLLLVFLVIIYCNENKPELEYCDVVQVVEVVFSNGDKDTTNLVAFNVSNIPSLTLYKSLFGKTCLMYEYVKQNSNSTSIDVIAHDVRSYKVISRTITRKEQAPSHSIKFNW